MELLAAASGLLLLLALDHAALGMPFLADDFLFLDEARRGLLSSLARAYTEGTTYFRPLGREIPFWLLDRLSGGTPLTFHVANLALVLVAVVLIARVARRLAGPAVAALAATVYTLLYMHRVQIGFASCAQDLVATALALAALDRYLAGSRLAAAGLYGAAMLGKESVAMLPLVLAAWEAWRDPRPWSAAALRRAFRATWPVAAVAVLWIVAVPVLRSLRSEAEMTPFASAASGGMPHLEGIRLALLALVGLDQPWDALRASLPSLGLAWAPVLVAAAIPFAFRGLHPRSAEPERAGRRDLIRLGTLWALLGTVPLAVVADHFSGYYVSAVGAGFAFAVGGVLAQLPVVVQAGAFALAAYVHLAANLVPVYRLEPGDPAPRGASYTTWRRLKDQARYVRALERAVAEHAPAPGATIFLSQSLRFAEMGTAGPRAVRVWRRDPSLDLEFIAGYRPGTPGPKLFLRLDPRDGGFDALPQELVDAIVSGEEALARGRPAEARASLEGALARAHPRTHDLERAELRNSLGLAAFQLGDTAEARRQWSEVLSEAPANRGALLNLAAAAAGAGKLAEARSWVERTLAAHPDDPQALVYATRIAGELGDRDGAERAWRRLVTSHPQTADSLARLGEGW